MSIGHGEDTSSEPALLAARVNAAAVDQVYTPYGIFLLRVAIGIDWIAHACLDLSRHAYARGAAGEKRHHAAARLADIRP